MTFEKKFKEMARANDAVDRLRELQRRLIKENEFSAMRRDLAFRIFVLIVIMIIVGYAAMN